MTWVPPEIENYGLSNRTANALKRANILDGATVTQMTDIQLMRVRNFGKASLAEVRRVLSYRGDAVALFTRRVCPTCHGSGIEVITVEQP